MPRQDRCVGRRWLEGASSEYWQRSQAHLWVFPRTFARRRDVAHIRDCLDTCEREFGRCQSPCPTRDLIREICLRPTTAHSAEVDLRVSPLAAPQIWISHQSPIGPTP